MTNHQHNHNHPNFKGRKLVITIVLNLIITIAQVAGGLFSGSLSLLSDALHNFSDVISLIISYIATILSNKKQTVNKTFGYKRAEIVAAFINASTLIIIAIFLAKEAFKRFEAPEIISSKWVIILAIASILLNGLSVFILQNEAKNNMNIKSAYLHLLSDMFTSMAVLAGGILMYYYKIYWIDSVLTLAIAIYLIYVSWDLLIDSLKVLMLFTPSSITLNSINKEISLIQQVENIHHVHVWQLDDNQIHFEAHVDFKENLTLEEANLILLKIRKILHDKFDIEHVTLQPEYNVCDKKDLITTQH
ncbi:MAG: cation diffusion facilitator family transporter [Bacteroidales bacterium]|nr:cation diffusion facilitator family transporter [Bacteroidales bacterium]